MYVASVHELNYDIYVDFKFTKLALIMSNKICLINTFENIFLEDDV